MLRFRSRVLQRMDSPYASNIVRRVNTLKFIKLKLTQQDSEKLFSVKNMCHHHRYDVVVRGENIPLDLHAKSVRRLGKVSELSGRSVGKQRFKTFSDGAQRLRGCTGRSETSLESHVVSYIFSR